MPTHQFADHRLPQEVDARSFEEISLVGRISEAKAIIAELGVWSGGMPSDLLLRFAWLGAQCLDAFRGAGADFGGDLDGGWVQETAAAAGLLVPYERTAENGGHCPFCGDDAPCGCLMVAPAVGEAINASLAVGEAINASLAVGEAINASPKPWVQS